MKKFVLPGLLLATASCAVPRQPSPPSPESIDVRVRALMARERVEGMALAVIDAGRIVHVAAYGRRSRERNLPLTISTVMYGASLTKAAFAYMVLQLVDEGRLDLDKSLADLLPRPLPEYDDYRDLAAEVRWRNLTPRILLTHSSGFANFRWLEPDRKLRMHFDPGSQYAYSGEGVYLLQFVLEEGLKLDVGTEMQRRVFERFGMRNTSMTWRPDFSANLADGYSIEGTMEPHDERSSVSGAGSMDTTIEDQAMLWAGVMRGDGLSRASRKELVRSQLSITSAHQFPTLTAPRDTSNASIGLAAGLGLVVFEDVSGRAWFKGGHNDWTGNMLICLERGQRCLVMLANDVRAERIYPDIARMVLNDTRIPWRWEYGWIERR